MNNIVYLNDSNKSNSERTKKGISEFIHRALFKCSIMDFSEEAMVEFMKSDQFKQEFRHDDEAERFKRQAHWAIGHLMKMDSMTIIHETNDEYTVVIKKVKPKK